MLQERILFLIIQQKRARKESLFGSIEKKKEIGRQCNSSYKLRNPSSKRG